VSDLDAKFIGGDLVLPKIDAPVARYGHDNGIVLVGVGHGNGVGHLGHVYLHFVLKHGGDVHEDDQQYQHHVHHRCDIDVGVDLTAFVTNCDCHRSEEHTSELQSLTNLVCRLL